MRKKVATLFLLLPISCLGLNFKGNIDIEADRLEYSEPQGRKEISANGNVIVRQKQKFIYSDHFTYNHGTQNLRADGDVRFLDGKGNMLRAKKAEADKSLDHIDIRDFQIELKDRSSFTGKHLARIDKNLDRIEDGTYTACQCKHNKYQWRIKAKDISIDHQAHSAFAKHAVLEVYGIPVFYLPFFYYNLPGIRGKSGFLAPKILNDSYLGFVLKTPYYWAISHNKEFILTPAFTGNKSTYLTGEYNHVLDNGRYGTKISLTKKENFKEDHANRNTNRFYLQSKGDFVLRDNWHHGFDINRSSDKTYLKQYKISDQDLLTTQIYSWNYADQDYTLLRGLFFQDLRVNSEAIDMIPNFRLHREFDLPNNVVFAVDGDASSFYQETSTKVNKLSSTCKFQKSLISDFGIKISSYAGLRMDYFNYNIVDTHSEQEHFARAIPQFGATISYPLYKTTDFYNWLMEPKLQLNLMPNHNYNAKIHNVDSNYFLFNQTNLFNNNRFSGNDLVESGTRITYGVNNVITIGNADYTAFLGQSAKARFNKFDQNYYDKRFSDYIGEFGMTRDKLLDISYKFSMDRDKLFLKYNEVDFGINSEKLFANIGFVNIRGEKFRQKTKGINFSIGSNHYRSWSTKIELSKNLGENFTRTASRGLVSFSASITHHGDCTDWSVKFLRDATKNIALQPSNTWWFSIKLKNIN